jgi:hypothetical protein
MMVCSFFYMENLIITNNIYLLQVRRAYRKKALETHPDKLEPGATEAEKQDAEQQFHKVRSFFFTCSCKKVLCMILNHGRIYLGPRGVPNSWGYCETQGWLFFLLVRNAAYDELLAGV